MGALCVESPPPSHRKKNILPKNLLLVKSKRQMSRSPIRCARGLFIFSTPFDPHHRPTHPPSFVRCTLLCTLRHLFFREATPSVRPPSLSPICVVGFRCFAHLGRLPKTRGEGEGAEVLSRERGTKGVGRSKAVASRNSERGDNFLYTFFFLFLLSSLLDRECLGFQTR